MADKMMRTSGRGLDGKAKPFLVDNDGSAIVKSPTLDTIYFYQLAESGTSEAVNIEDFNSISFHVTGNFQADITFQANSYGEVWHDIRVEDSDGYYCKTADSPGFYKADISGYTNVRVVVNWIGGTRVSINSFASASSFSNTNAISLFGLEGQNKVVDTTENDYHVGKGKAYYGGENSVNTDRARITPVNYTDFSKKVVYVKNNSDKDLFITGYNKHIDEDASKILESIETNILIPKNGGTGKLSYIQYPDLNEPFNGLTIDLTSFEGQLTSGDIKIHWTGGNE